MLELSFGPNPNGKRSIKIFQDIKVGELFTPFINKTNHKEVWIKLSEGESLYFNNEGSVETAIFPNRNRNDVEFLVIPGKVKIDVILD